MATVEITEHLHTFFPSLGEGSLEVEAATVAGVVEALEERAPGFAFYVCDERGRLRRHVNVFVDDVTIADRRTLSDAVGPTSRVLILQALSGG
ncbi:MAG: MoaD/ThiS family protein [Sandaracinaceae bacterium]